ncbi:MAG: GMC family oxidoreductase, partial [Chloroflexota bacterium]
HKLRQAANEPKQKNSQSVWHNQSTDQIGLNGRRVLLPSGRGSGGTDRLSFLVWDPPSPGDFDDWQIPGWGYQDIWPYISKAEEMLKPQKFDLSTLEDNFWEITEELGFTASQSSLLLNRSGRQSISETYMRAFAYNSNLAQRHRVHVLNLLFKEERVVGVRAYWEDSDEVREIRANKEIILCAGALRSPQILLLSGIGPAKHLRQKGLHCRVPLEAVGQNLQDHITISFQFEASDQLNRRGKGFFNRGPSIENTATMQANLFEDFMLQLWPEIKWGSGRYTELRLVWCQSGNRGSVRLRTTDGIDQPLINPNYLGDERDIEAMKHGVETLKAYVDHSKWPLPYYSTLKIDRVDERRMRKLVVPAWNYVGTCKMGTDPKDSVVDPHCRVHGVENVRVVDASVIPLNPGRMPMAHVVAAAEKCAADILGVKAQQ